MLQLGYGTTVLPMVSSFTNRVGNLSIMSSSAPASTTWESANRAVYQPIILRAGCVARRVWWANGATVSGGATVEVGVYADSGYGPGVKLVSGSAVQGNASEVQFVDVTDTTLAPGLYWLAITASTATNTTIGRMALNSALDAVFRFQQSTANPLPGTATPVESGNSNNLWLCGFATTASP